MKLLAGEYKKQSLHSRYKAPYYTFTPRMLTDEELWVQDVELSILTAKVYKELGVDELCS